MPARQSLFFVSMSLGMDETMAANYSLMRNGSPYVKISRSHPLPYNRDTTSRDTMVEMISADQLHLASYFNTYSTPWLYTSLTILSISDAFGLFPIAFSVARDEVMAGFTNPVTFNIMLANEGSAYDEVSHRFVAPRNAIYYFSISVGMFPESAANLVLYVNDDPFVNIIRESTIHSGTDTTGRSIMVQLQTGDTVHIVNERNQLAFSSEGLETSFSGFLYDPAHGNQVTTKYM